MTTLTLTKLDCSNPLASGPGIVLESKKIKNWSETAGVEVKNETQSIEKKLDPRNSQKTYVIINIDSLVIY
jgi:hypothetical protein